MSANRENSLVTTDQNAGLGMAIGFAGVCIFGATLPVTHIALESFGPWFVTHARAIIAGIAAILCLLTLGKRLPRDDAKILFVAGLLLVFGFPGFSSVAMQTVPASHGGVVLGILPLVTSVFASLIGGEKPSAMFWLFGAVGAVLVVTFAIRDSGMTLAMGDIWLFASCICASLGYVISGKLSRKMPGWEVICWALVLVLPLSLIFGWFTYEPDFAEPSARSTIALGYLGLGSMFFGFFAWNIGLAMGGIARVGQVQLLQAFITIAVSAFLLDEAIGLETVVFASAVVAIVALARRARIDRR